MTRAGDGLGRAPTELTGAKHREDAARGKSPAGSARSKYHFRAEKTDTTPIGKTRGYIKLSQATAAFHFDFHGKTVLDIGSSTGGFTQYALDHGAKKVIAVEKGTKQMQAPLRYDPRIELYEKTDIFDFAVPAVDVIVADVSFISLTKILEYLKKSPEVKDTDYLIMLKPQFEAKPDQVNQGVVKNEKIRRDIIKNFEQWLKNSGYVVVKKRDNDLKGKTGNQERFYWLSRVK